MLSPSPYQNNFPTLKIKAACSSKTLANINQITQHSPEGCNLYTEHNSWASMMMMMMMMMMLLLLDSWRKTTKVLKININKI
jgi:hypothetical protein